MEGFRSAVSVRIAVWTDLALKRIPVNQQLDPAILLLGLYPGEKALAIGRDRIQITTKDTPGQVRAEQRHRPTHMKCVSLRTHRHSHNATGQIDVEDLTPVGPPARLQPTARRNGPFTEVD